MTLQNKSPEEARNGRITLQQNKGLHYVAQLGMVEHAYNPSAPEAEAEKLASLGYLWRLCHTQAHSAALEPCPYSASGMHASPAIAHG